MYFMYAIQRSSYDMFWRKIYGHDWPPCIDKLQQNKINGTMDKLGQTTSYCNGLNDDVENWSLSCRVQLVLKKNCVVIFSFFLYEMSVEWRKYSFQLKSNSSKEIQFKNPTRESMNAYQYYRIYIYIEFSKSRFAKCAKH